MASAIWTRYRNTVSARQDVSDFLAALALTSLYYGLYTLAEVVGVDAIPRWPVGYLYLLVLLGGTVFAFLRPGISVLACLALLPLTRAPEVPHTFTTAPADYLMVGIAARVVVMALSDKTLRHRLVSPVAIFLAVSAAAVLSFLVNIAEPDGLPLKLRIAETVGISLSALYPFAIVGMIRAETMKLALVMLITGCAFTVLFGLLGGLQTIACLLPTGGDAPFVIPGSRVSGLAADPNQFAALAVALSAAAAALLEFTRASPTVSRVRLPAIVLLLVTGGTIILAGSRTGMIIYLLFCAIWFLTSWRQFRLVPVIAACTVAGLSATALWSHLPCPLRDDPLIIRFAERNDEAAVLARMAGQDVGAPTEQHLTNTFSQAIETLPKKVIQKDGAGGEGGEGGEEEVSRQFVTDFAATLADETWKLAAAIGADSARQNLWHFAVLLWGEKPLFGWGPGNMAAQTPNGWRAHNTVLTTAAEMGTVGVGALVLTAAIVVVVTVRRLRYSTVGWRGWLLLLTGLVVLSLSAMSQDSLRQGAVWAFAGLVLCLPPPLHRSKLGSAGDLSTAGRH